jgi:hypothetical protein
MRERSFKAYARWRPYVHRMPRPVLLRALTALALLATTGCAARSSGPARLTDRLDRVPLGTQVRVTLTAGHSVIGTLLAPPDSVLRYGTAEFPLITPVSMIRSLEVQHHGAKRGLTWGTVAGGIVAGTVWALRARARCDPGCDGAMMRGFLEAAPFGALYGGITGAVMGASQRRWTRRWP